MGHTLETKRDYLLSNLSRQNASLDRVKSRLEVAIDEDNDFRVESLERQMNDINNRIYRLESQIEFLRDNIPSDMEERLNVYKTFSKSISDVIPDGEAIVFHGSNNIGVIREILKSGGLLTPEERNVSMTSFASQIDVTYKSYVQTSVEFAEGGIDSFLPYGAIFAFIPLDSEVDKVISTGESTEVMGGVAGCNFRNEPDRLVGIITTLENKDRVLNWCLEYGIPPRVFTHDEFISFCKDKYHNKEMK